MKKINDVINAFFDFGENKISVFRNALKVAKFDQLCHILWLHLKLLISISVQMFQSFQFLSSGFTFVYKALLYLWHFLNHDEFSEKTVKRFSRQPITKEQCQWNCIESYIFVSFKHFWEISSVNLLVLFISSYYLSKIQRSCHNAEIVTVMPTLVWGIR